MTDLGGRDPSTVALGTWSGGCFMSFGQNIGETRFVELFRRAYEIGIRTFVTADVYGLGRADRLLGEALQDYERDSYCLIGAIGHDFYEGSREGEKGFPRFTDPRLRGSRDYAGYLRMATEKSLERLGVDAFDVLLLHNPDSIGYTSEDVWEGMAELMEAGLTRMLGIAPGPANGFTLDIIAAFEKFHSLIDWVMLILNPLEPWPTRLVLPAARKHDVSVLARVVDHGGLFLDSLRAGDKLLPGDHRSFRGPGWVESAEPKLAQMRKIADNHSLTLLQLACRWTLAQDAVRAAVPTLIQEASPHAKSIEALLEELAPVPMAESPTPAELELISQLGDNTGCMPLKGASPQYSGPPQADQWPMADYHWDVARRWGIEPDRDLYCPHDRRDMREKGAPEQGIVRAVDRRLYVHFVVYRGRVTLDEVAREIDAFAKEGVQGAVEWVLYCDTVDPRSFAVAAFSESPELLGDFMRGVALRSPLDACTVDADRTLYGRTYATGRETDLAEVLLDRPKRYLLNPRWNWAIWYPLRRKPEFELLPPNEQNRVLMEHAMIGRLYGECDYAHDIRLISYGLDRNDNEFVVGLVGDNLHRLSKLVQDMRKTRHTAEYIESLGPFFVGRVVRRSTTVE